MLVHGLFHEACCWYKVVSHLRLASYRVTAVDLGSSWVHPSRLEDVATFSDYIQPLIQLLESLSAEERVVLVGHNYIGLAIAPAMETGEVFTHCIGVFISAYMPNSRGPPALQMKQVCIMISISC